MTTKSVHRQLLIHQVATESAVVSVLTVPPSLCFDAWVLILQMFRHDNEARILPLGATGCKYIVF